MDRGPPGSARYPGLDLSLIHIFVDLIAPVLVLIAACIFGMIYTGGFFDGVDFVTAFADCNASMYFSIKAKHPTEKGRAG